MKNVTIPSLSEAEMGGWELASIAVPLIVAHKFGDLHRRLLGNRRRFASIFPAGMQRAVSIWVWIAAIVFVGGPSLLAVGLLAGPPQLTPFGISLCGYSAVWTAVGQYILRSQREYVRWWRLRRDVIRYLAMPVDRRPPRPPAGAVLV